MLILRNLFLYSLSFILVLSNLKDSFISMLKFLSEIFLSEL